MLLLILIVFNVLVYIFSLNITVWEGFQREKVQKNLRLLRGELRDREEVFISELTHFYQEHAGSLASPVSSEPRFVLRRGNVAQVGKNFLR